MLLEIYRVRVEHWENFRKVFGQSEIVHELSGTFTAYAKQKKVGLNRIDVKTFYKENHSRMFLQKTCEAHVEILFWLLQNFFEQLRQRQEKRTTRKWTPNFVCQVTAWQRVHQKYIWCPAIFSYQHWNKMRRGSTKNQISFKAHELPAQNDNQNW